MKLQPTKIPEGYNWTIEYTNDAKEFNIKDYILHLEPEQKEGRIIGEILAERLKTKGLSANVLDYLLENKDLIPKEWKGKAVFFWGTIYRDGDGSLYVRYLYWDGGWWYWDYYCLDHVWDAGSPALLLASTLNSETKPSKSLSPLTLEKLNKIEDLIKEIKQEYE